MNTSLVQVYPSRITITQPRRKQTFGCMPLKAIKTPTAATKKRQYEKNFAKKKNSFILSQASKKKLLDSVSSMYMLSEPRKIKMKTDKYIYNFRMAFITLTLPSQQEHSDTFIKSECLNHFLVELRHIYNVQNYVWKAELQDNENIHFHLILDKYVDFQALRRRWNRILDKHGYVKSYQQKMSKLTLSEYHKLRCKTKKITFQESAEAYAQGKKSNWSNPNSVDVRSVYNKKKLAIYLAKYITKKVSKDKLSPELQERQKIFGRSWSRSYSIVNLKYQNKYELVDVAHFIKYLKSIPNKVKYFFSNYFEVFYFNADSLCAAFKQFHYSFLIANAKMYNYPFP